MRGLVAPRQLNLPAPGIEPMPSALAGRFLSSAPPGKSINLKTVVGEIIEEEVSDVKWDPGQWSTLQWEGPDLSQVTSWGLGQVHWDSGQYFAPWREVEWESGIRTETILIEWAIMAIQELGDSLVILILVNQTMSQSVVYLPLLAASTVFLQPPLWMRVEFAHLLSSFPGWLRNWIGLGGVQFQYW